MVNSLKKGSGKDERKIMKKTGTVKITMTAMMMCLIIVATILIRIPVPATQGYVHFGDAMIFLSVLIMGWKYGAAAAGVGSMLADILGGYAAWAPWTLVIKGVMAVIMGLFLSRVAGKKGRKGYKTVMELLGMALGGIFMVAGYYFAEAVMYGNWLIPLAGIPWNIGQFAVGMVIATAIAAALYKTPAGEMFEYRINEKNRK